TKHTRIFFINHLSVPRPGRSKRPASLPESAQVRNCNSGRPAPLLHRRERTERTKNTNIMKISKDTLKTILKVIVTVATAIAGVLGVKAMTP
ncbi:smalltalk protein, partial [Bacteroides heparinolyticus]